MGIVVLGAVFVDIKGYPADVYIPGGRNAGRVEIVHGGVSRNLVEDIANVELRPTFVSLVDTTGTGADVIRKLQDHKVNTDYIRAVPDGMGTWLAVFNNGGDVVASISKRPDLRPIVDILDDHGDEIFRNADSIALEIDCDKEIVKAVFYYAEKYRKPVFAAVSISVSPWNGGTFCASAPASCATSRRREFCSQRTMTARPRRSCGTFWPTTYRRRRSPGW